MPIPLGPITWALQKLVSAGIRIPNWLKRRRLKKAVAAWDSVDFQILSHSLVNYYELKGVPLFCYPGESRKVPLYVRKPWLTLSESSLHMSMIQKETPVQMTKPQKEFLDLYPRVRRALGLTQLWNGRVFRIVALETSEDQLDLKFELGHFFDTLAYQYVLEHEARLALSRGPEKAIDSRALPLRESLASTPHAIEAFCETQCARIGVSNLLLFRLDNDTYRPAIRSRGNLSMGHLGDFDPMSSGMFDISTYDPNVDFRIQYKVLKEIYEELFGGKEVEKEMRGLDPDFFFEKAPIKDLIAMLEDGRACFQVTGFCVDLVRMVPEISTVTIVTDSSYYARYRLRFKNNLEYGPPSFCNIPRSISNVDEYLAKQFPSNPGQPESAKGFDSSRWTLPGAFCFYQGLKRAVNERLL